MSSNGTATLARNEDLASRVADTADINKTDLAKIDPSDAAWIVAEAARLCIEKKHYHSAANILVDAYRSRAELHLSEDHAEEFLNRAREARRQGSLGNVHADVLGAYSNGHRKK